MDALELVENHSITLLEDVDHRRRIFRVEGSSQGGDPEYYCYRYANYCTCPAFLYKIMSQARSILCKHLIAVRIAEATGTSSKRLEDFDTIALLLENLGRPKQRIFKGEHVQTFQRKELSDAEKGIFDFGPSQPLVKNDNLSQACPVKVKTGTLYWINSHAIPDGKEVSFNAPTEDEPLTQSVDKLFSSLPSEKQIE